ncbi:putative PAN/Apple domain-containing protein [Septoria linicola]|nr:putative PAN/Apple domain-containing protein [Septoria linicola]
MKFSLILLGVTAAVSAATQESPLEGRTTCSAHRYRRCCGTNPWKRTLEARTLCRNCFCQPPEQPQPHPPASTTPVQPPMTTTKAPEQPTTTTSESKTSSTSQTAPPQETGPGSCKATIGGSSGPCTDADGVKYTVNCGKDIAGGDFAAEPVPSFVDCFELCSAYEEECVGFSFLNGVCYLKSSQNGPLVDSAADVAQKVNPPSPRPTTTTTRAAATTTTNPTAIPTGACRELGSNFGAYTVECGTDYPGGHLSNAPSPDFVGCVAQCDKLPGCLGSSFNGENGPGVCFFKDKKTRAQPNPHVDSAFRLRCKSVAKSLSLSRFPAAPTRAKWTWHCCA